MFVNATAHFIVPNAQLVSYYTIAWCLAMTKFEICLNQSSHLFAIILKVPSQISTSSWLMEFSHNCAQHRIGRATVLRTEPALRGGGEYPLP
jgi:hypothetical protein